MVQKRNLDFIEVEIWRFGEDKVDRINDYQDQDQVWNQWLTDAATLDRFAKATSVKEEIGEGLDEESIVVEGNNKSRGCWYHSIG